MLNNVIHLHVFSMILNKILITYISLIFVLLQQKFSLAIITVLVKKGTQYLVGRAWLRTLAVTRQNSVAPMMLSA